MKLFWMHVNKRGPYPETYCIAVYPEIAGIRCEEWTGCCIDGYGALLHEGKKQLAHRVIYEHRHGKIPDGKCVLHKCDNRKCVRDDHHFVGSKKNNAQDREAKGRHHECKGTSNGRSKLTEKDVHLIRRKFKTGKYTLIRLAIKFEVHPTQIRRVVNRLTWKHVA